LGWRTTICGRAKRSGTATGASSMYSGAALPSVDGAASAAGTGLASV
jgi:hypothetical protein